MLPHEFPSWSKVYRYYHPGAATAPGRSIHDALREQVRAEPRNPVPGLLTVRRSRPRKKGLCGYDAGKKRA